VTMKRPISASENHLAEHDDHSDVPDC
jgi:hypothetical protein